MERRFLESAVVPEGRWEERSVEQPIRPARKTLATLFHRDAAARMSTGLALGEASAD